MLQNSEQYEIIYDHWLLWGWRLSRVQKAVVTTGLIFDDFQERYIYIFPKN